MSNLTPRLRVPICFCAVGRSRKAHMDSTRTRIDSSELGRNSSNSALGQSGTTPFPQHAERGQQL
jgi:hypothetical protein